ncbi:MAG: cation:proton antiporter [Endomicrobium sp.]|jgi:Kef-type K+ transport system membrane component KefB|nr:cation:proton antiporter [Endomicrobium sp.]
MNELFYFLISLSFILIFSKIFGEVALKFNQNKIIGELVAGIIIGPSVLGIVNKTTALSYISELGVIILLFEVGLSIGNVRDLFKVGVWSTIVAFTGVVIPCILGYFVFLLFGLTNVQSIFAGTVLTATSISIASRVFLDLKCLDTQEAKIVLGAAVIDDIIVFVMLAVISEFILNKAVTFNTFFSICKNIMLFLTISTITCTFVVLLISKFILKKMKYSNTIFIIGISVCFFLSSISLKTGLTSMIGAFIAGVVFSMIGTQQIEKMKKEIKQIHVFFVPVFFVLIGTSVDINKFNPFTAGNKEILILTAILFIVALVGKLLTGFFVVKNDINKFLIGASMIPRGEVGLALSEIGLKYGILGTRDYNSLIAVIILTTFITPIILKYIVSKQNDLIR